MRQCAGRRSRPGQMTETEVCAGTEGALWVQRTKLRSEVGEVNGRQRSEMQTGQERHGLSLRSRPVTEKQTQTATSFPGPGAREEMRFMNRKGAHFTGPLPCQQLQSQKPPERHSFVLFCFF